MSTYTAEMAQQAVERGAQFLDNQCPTWFREIDLELLDLSSGQLCVLGQTASCITKKSGTVGYWDVMHAKGINGFGKWPVLRGFNIPEPKTAAEDREDDARYEMLTIAWKSYIRTRLEAAAAA